MAANIVPKIVNLFSFVTTSILTAFNRGASPTDFEVCLYKKCVMVLGNLAQSRKADPKIEILKSKVLDTFACLLDPRPTENGGSGGFNAMLQMGPEILEPTLWFLTNIMVNFETRYLS